MIKMNKRKWIVCGLILVLAIAAPIMEKNVFKNKFVVEFDSIAGDRYDDYNFEKIYTIKNKTNDSIRGVTIVLDVMMSEGQSFEYESHIGSFEPGETRVKSVWENQIRNEAISLGMSGSGSFWKCEFKELKCSDSSSIQSVSVLCIIFTATYVVTNVVMDMINKRKRSKF